MQDMQVQYMETLQDLEEEIDELKAFIEKLRKSHVNLVLQTKELIKEERNCHAIIIRNESELHLLMLYCFVDPEFSSEAIPNKMVEIDAELREKEFHDVVYQVQMRGWLCRRYLPPQF